MVRSVILLVAMICISTDTCAREWRRMLIAERLEIRVEVVTTLQEQVLGLGNRDSLAEGTGMLFRYSAPGERIFWMKRMRFPIDIIWIRKEQIIFIEHHVPPPSPLTSDTSLKRYGKGILADAVLELPAGYATRHDIIPGQPVQLDH